MNEQSKETKDLAITKSNELSPGFDNINLLSESGIAKAKLFLTEYMRSDKAGIKSINDGLAIMARAQDLSLPFTTCVEHIHVINGKTGVDVHIIKSLLLRAGVSWERIKDYTPQYNYTDGTTIYLETQLPDYCFKCKNAKESEEKSTVDNIGVYPLAYYKDLKGNLYNQFQISDKCVICINQNHAIKVAKEGKFPVIRVPAQPVDYVTEFEFKRTIHTSSGNKEMTVRSRFSYSEAVTADFFKKDTYVKYARIMIDHRAFTLGARDIADDLIMGCMESGELGLINDTTLENPEYVEVDEA
uniref:Uncharacterized protein n=1 Tax=Geladintestivirus 1 TaxID=3233133 RepID=A0AAU8MI66_9CAUD